jgi:hypothetical protein
MSNPITSLLSGSLDGLLKGVADVVDRFVTTDEEKTKAKLALLDLQRQAQKDLLEADAEFAKAQASVVVAEAQSESWLTRSWRPIVMLSFTTCVLYNLFVAPLFALPVVPLPTEMWDSIRYGLTGYIAGRSLEKIAPQIGETVKTIVSRDKK